MNLLLPYVGAALLIAAGTVAILILARHGLRLRRLRHKTTELEFDSDAPAPKSDTVPQDSVLLSEQARMDCQALEISPADAVAFIVGEATRHPILFLSAFSSVSLVFLGKILLVSWDCQHVRIERILSRTEAYPLNEIWTDWLAAYRLATLLSYRRKGPDALLLTSEARRSLAAYKGLIDKAESFSGVYRQHRGDIPHGFTVLRPLLVEAEFALANSDASTSISRMEALLSTVHKLILECAPQGPAGKGTVPNADPTTSKPLAQRGKPSVLLVDDDSAVLDFLKGILDDAGFEALVADSSSEAMRVMVDREFDVVVTDLVMSVHGRGDFDGCEVTRVAKKSSRSTKVIVISGWGMQIETSRLLDGEEAADIYMPKPFSPSEFVAAVRGLLRGRHEER